MKSVDESIEALSRAMHSEAKTEAESILVEAKKKADAIQKQAQEQADLARKEILEHAQQEASRLRGQVIATTQMKARTMELEHREKLLEDVFAASLKQIPSVQQRTDYKEIAIRLVHEAVAQLNSTDVKIRADEQTQKLLTKQVIDEISKDTKVNLIIGQPLAHGTGVIAETMDGHLQYDNTLETRLSRLQNTLRSPVYRILKGETV